MQGDASKLVEMVAAGAAKAYVVSNHIRDPADLRAEEMAVRVASLLGKNKNCYMYGTTPVFALYVVGAGVRAALQ